MERILLSYTLFDHLDILKYRDARGVQSTSRMEAMRGISVRDETRADQTRLVVVHETGKPNYNPTSFGRRDAEDDALDHEDLSVLSHQLIMKAPQLLSDRRQNDLLTSWIASVLPMSMRRTKSAGLCRHRCTVVRPRTSRKPEQG